MHIAFLNPQGNFDPNDSYWTEHPDFGGQLVYVKNVALALGEMGHRVDILTRQIVAPEWPEFASRFDTYPNAPNVRIVRLPAGPSHFLPKEELWPHIPRDWVPNILDFYREEGHLPDAFTAHYGDGGIAGVLIENATRIPFTFTAHSLGAIKMDKLQVTPDNLAEMDARYHFGRRLVAERLSMNRSAVNIVSTRQERFEQYGHRAYKGAVNVHDDRRFEVIPPGVNLATFDAQARAPHEEAIHALIQEKLARDLTPERLPLPAIIASSRLDPKKNHVGLVLAYAASPALQERANRVLITAGLDDPLHRPGRGSSPEEQILRRIRGLISEHHLWGKVSAFSLRGQEALAAAYRFFARRRSVFALPALYEPFGLAPLEAAAAGLPVVVTQNGGPSESLQENGEEFGILVNPRDPEDIARGLERAILDPATWEHFAHKGRARVLSRYTWEHTAEGYAQVLHAIVAAPNARRPASLLPIHPYFLSPSAETDSTLPELATLYFGPVP